MALTDEELKWATILVLTEPSQRYFLKQNKELITRIAIIIPPDKTVYRSGEEVDYTGMIVAGYDENDQFVRNIAFSELINVTQYAEIPESGLPPIGTAGSSRVPAELDNPFQYTTGPIGVRILINGYIQDRVFVNNAEGHITAITAWQQNDGSSLLLAASDSPEPTMEYDRGSVPAHNLSLNWTYQNKTVYYYLNYYSRTRIVSVPNAAFGRDVRSGVATATTAWTMIYGELSSEGVTQQISVSFINKEQTVLTATSEITVTV